MAHIITGGRRIEIRTIPGPAEARPVLLLHEGLGSAQLWRGFPERLARRLRAPVIAYSRRGYGRSEGLGGAPRTPRFMHEEALEALPLLIRDLRLRRPLLVGHSDGASIALIHAAAGGADDGPADIAGLVLMAPHVMVEQVSVASIARIRARYRTSDLRERLSRHHDNVDDAFLGWADTWLSPEFRAWSLAEECRRLVQPCLLIQGTADEYGTMAQIDTIAALARGPVERLVLTGVGHAPWREAEDQVVEAIGTFADRLDAKA